MYSNSRILRSACIARCWTHDNYIYIIYLSIQYMLYVYTLDIVMGTQCIISMKSSHIGIAEIYSAAAGGGGDCGRFRRL